MSKLSPSNYAVILLSGAAAFALCNRLIFPRGLHLGSYDASILAALIVSGIALWVEKRPTTIKVTGEYEEDAGYWRIRRPDGENYDICFATHRSRYRIPEPDRQGNWELVGKIHCVVKDRFWVWREDYDRDGVSRPVVPVSFPESRGY